MGRANHVNQAATPSGVDPAWKAKAILRYFIQSRPGHHTSHLSLLRKSNQVGQHAEMLATPILPSSADPGLHLIENQQEFVFIAQPAQRGQPLAAKMVITPFA